MHSLYYVIVLLQVGKILHTHAHIHSHKAILGNPNNSLHSYALWYCETVEDLRKDRFTANCHWKPHGAGALTCLR